MPRKHRGSRNKGKAPGQGPGVVARFADGSTMTAVTVGKTRGAMGREYSSALDGAIGRLFGAVVSNPDKTVDLHAYRHSSTGVELYTEMTRKDAQIKHCLDMRTLTVLAQGWQIEPVSSDTEDVDRAEWVEQAMLQVRHFFLSRGLFFRGISHGYSPAEMMFDTWDGSWIIREFLNREPHRFGFDDNGGLTLLERGGQSCTELMPENKFIVNTWGADETPYGSGLLKHLYPLWFFKNHAMKSFFKFLEKFGTPTLVGEYPLGTSTEEQAALLDILHNMVGSSSVIKPEGTKLEIARTEGVSAISAVFKWAVEEYVDRQIAKLILGQTLSTESQAGTHALAKFQSKSQQHIAESDGQWQQEIMSQVVRLLIDLNFGPMPSGKYPLFRIPYEEERDIATYLAALSIAVNDLGLPVAADHVYELTSIPPPKDDEILLPGKQAAPQVAPGLPFDIGGVPEGDDAPGAIPDEADGLSSGASAAKFIQAQQAQAWKRLSTQLLGSQKVGKRFVRTYR